LSTIPPISTTRAITSKTVMVINSTNINNKGNLVVDIGGIVNNYRLKRV
jgi:hypothetical protein